MNHEEIQDRLSDYWDGELPSEEMTETAAHLQDCAQCRAELGRYRRIDAAARGPVKAPTPFETEVFARAVLRRLEPLPEVAFLSSLLSSPRRSLPAFLLAAIALVLVAIPGKVNGYDPTVAMLIRQDNGRTFAWLLKPAGAAAADALELVAR
jgi:anti-sigma factor RsiW